MSRSVRTLTTVQSEEEEFALRQSVTSRGSFVQKHPEAQRAEATAVQRDVVDNDHQDDRSFHDSNPYEDSYWGEGESEITVTEIVEEREEEYVSEVELED